MKWLDFKWIPLEQLKVSESNIRQSLVDQEKAALKICLRKKKVLDTLTVIYNEDDQMYEIIKGQRRFLAACELRDEGLEIPKLPCVIKEMTEIEGIEESLLDELMRVAVEPNDTGKAVLKLIEHYGDLNKVSSSLGVNPDWLDYYVQHLNLNPPASVIVAAKPTSTKEVSLEKFAEEQKEIAEGKKTEIEPSPFANLSLDERKEAERLLKENPKLSPIVLKSKAKDWIANSYELMFRVEAQTYRALVQWSKDHKKTVRRVLDLWANESFKKKLKEEKYL